MPLGADPRVVTIAGFGSGASMAMQMDVAHSDVFAGVGLLNGGLYSSDDFGYDDPDATIHGSEK